MKIPVKAAKQIADTYRCRQVILLAWDGKFTHIVTYGKTVDDCSQAADGGNMLKERWGWPECNDQPSRVKSLQKALSDVLEIVEHGVPEPSHSGSCGPEAGCDGICVELASIAETVKCARKLL